MKQRILKKLVKIIQTFPKKKNLINTNKVVIIIKDIKLLVINKSNSQKMRKLKFMSKVIGKIK